MTSSVETNPRVTGDPTSAVQDTTLTLLLNSAATGAAQVWPGGNGVFIAVGTFGGATVALQYLGPDGATWVNVNASVSLTAAGMAPFNCPPGSVRATVTGGTPAGLYASASKAAF